MKTTFTGQKSSRFFNQLSSGDIFTCSSDGDGLYIKVDHANAVVITPRKDHSAPSGSYSSVVTTRTVWLIEELTAKIKE